MGEHFSEKLVERLENTPHVEKFREGPGRCKSNRYWQSAFNYNKAEAWWKSKVGQHFDKVFSEWCKAEWVPVNYRNMEGAEKGFKRTLMVDGVLCSMVWSWMITADWHGTYVHPKTKIICYKPKKKRVSYKKKEEQQRAQICRILDDYHQIFKMNGIWYDVKTAPTYVHAEYKWVDGPPETVLAPFGKEEFITRPGPKIHKRFETVRTSRKRVPFDRTDSRDCGKVTRRQLNKAELKAYGVTNDPVQYRGEPI